MSYPVGVNFRATAGFVTDDTGEYGEIVQGNDYPATISSGVTGGWTGGALSVGTRDRSSGNDRRLAGCHLTGDVGAVSFRFDLASPGQKIIRLAVGDASYARSNQKIEIFDNVTSLGVLFSGASTGAANSFLDAAGNVLTHAQWVASNSGAGGGTGVTLTFATTICRIAVGDGANFTYIAHAYIEDVAATQTLMGQICV